MSTHKESDIQALGAILKAKREERKLSTRALGTLAGVDDSTIVRLENGTRQAPRPEVLAKVAKALELSLAELYTLAGYTVPVDLPSLPAYLRVKYGDMPQAAQDELTNHLNHLNEKYGLDLNGPKPGEDEA
jgi:transcriptional regulator with XRE-family HTH domain